MFRLEHETLTQTSVPGTSFASIWGSGPSDVWAVATSGTVEHFDGQVWKPVFVPVATAWSDVFGTSANNVWFVGRGALAMHWDGHVFDTVDLGLGMFDVIDVVALGRPDQVLMLGHYLTREFDGESIVSVQSAISTPIGRWVSPTGAVYVTNGSLYRWVPESWTDLPTMTEAAVTGLFSSDNLYAVTDGGALLTLDYTHFDPLSIPDAGSSALNAFWWGNARDRFAVGDCGQRLREELIPQPFWNSTATSWTHDDIAEDAGCSANLYAVWSAEPELATAVGKEGRIFEFDYDWRELPSPTTSTLRGVWGAEDAGMWAVGDDGTILHRTAAGWEAAQIHSQASFRAIHGLTPDDIWAVGDGATVAHWDGGEWAVTQLPLQNMNFRAVYALSPTDVLVGGDRGFVFRYRPVRWGP
jgi:hypothetical protein